MDVYGFEFGPNFNDDLYLHCVSQPPRWFRDEKPEEARTYYNHSVVHYRGLLGKRLRSSIVSLLTHTNINVVQADIHVNCNTVCQ